MNVQEQLWQPIGDIPLNLGDDGRHYVAWVWALLDDGIDVDRYRSFSELEGPGGARLLAEAAAEHLDHARVLAIKAASADGHDFTDVIFCCRAPTAIPASLLKNCVVYSQVTRTLPSPGRRVSERFVTSRENFAQKPLI